MDVQHELERAGSVYLDRHFVYKSLKHGPGYINPDPIFPDLYTLKRFCEGLAEPFMRSDIETVASPATGGIPLGTLTALALDGGLGIQVHSVWADKDGDDFHFERDTFPRYLAGRRVLVVEDLLTTGGSVAKVCREAERHDAEIIGVSVICNRGGVTAEQLGVPRLESLLEVNFEAVDEGDCELCAQGVPIVEDIGHGREFKLSHPDYKGDYIKLLS